MSWMHTNAQKYSMQVKLIYAFTYCNIRGTSWDIRSGLSPLLILWSSTTQPRSLWQWICNGRSGDASNSQNVCCLSHIVLDNIMEFAVSVVDRKTLSTHLTVSKTKNILNCLFCILEKGHQHFHDMLSSWASKSSSIGRCIRDINTTSNAINFTFWRHSPTDKC